MKQYIKAGLLIAIGASAMSYLNSYVEPDTIKLSLIVLSYVIAFVLGGFTVLVGQVVNTKMIASMMITNSHENTQLLNTIKEQANISKAQTTANMNLFKAQSLLPSQEVHGNNTNDDIMVINMPADRDVFSGLG